ncbi:MAG TPA: endonuclease/exonuclease/phosphatase family protein [Luteolibacter sp.]
MRLPGTPNENDALGFLGALFCTLVLCALTACEKSGTPDWTTSGTRAPVSSAEKVPEKTPPIADEAAPLPPSAIPASASSGKLRFITYNVENWLTMDRESGGKTLKSVPKPESEKQAVVALLARHAPDIIGLCEIGEAKDLAEIQADLKAAGLDLPHSHYTGGSDPVRHLGLISRFPIISTAKPAETEYRHAGQTFAINRGILDATVTAHGKTYRFLGAHLKSKRDSEQGDQEAIRLNEARLLRRHIDTLFNANENARIVVYGDLNDTRATPAIRTITGNHNDPTSLTAIPAKDSRNDSWTYHWALHDLYSRIDYVMVSRALREEVNFPAAKVIDDTGWDTASDHRPVLTVFR